MNRLSPVFCLLSTACFSSALASIPLPSTPSWQSHDNDYSTGGTWADINGDGWLDLVTSNGNDMAQNTNSVYRNLAGSLETLAWWRSADNGYFGHCYSGDCDNDGDPDLAVAYLGSGTSGEFKVRLYRNDAGTLGTLPVWKAADRHSSFDCCLGDVDLDGDLDLAISAGDAYQNETDSARIYFNNDGVFDTLPGWTAHEGHPSDAVRFCDVDDDGDLDLFVGQVIPNEDRGFITMYRNNAGALDPEPAWTARAGVGWVLRLAFGDYDNDGWLDLAAASNNQTGEPNSIKVFHNRAGVLDTVASYTMLQGNEYSSCVAWADVNGDGFSDLAAGGWWEPAVVFENRAGVLDTLPGWQSQNNSTLVCEALVWADVRNSHLVAGADTFYGNGTRRLWTLSRRPVQFLDSVTIEGVRLPTPGFCFDLLVGWFSIGASIPSGMTVVCYYRYSTCADLAVTNWDRTRGNRLYLNTTPSAVADGRRTPDIQRLTLSARPNPFRSSVRFSCSGTPDPLTPGTLAILDPAGRLVRSFTPHSSLFTLDLSSLSPGLYFARLGNGQSVKLTRLGSGSD
jgi:hypothetical protein